MRKLRRIAQVVVAQGLLLVWRASEALAQTSNPGWLRFDNVDKGGDLTRTLQGIGQGIVGALASVFAIVFIGAVIWTSKKLALGATNPQARSEAMSGYLWIIVSGIAAFAASTIAAIAYWVASRG